MSLDTDQHINLPNLPEHLETTVTGSKAYHESYVAGTINKIILIILNFMKIVQTLYVNNTFNY